MQTLQLMFPSYKSIGLSKTPIISCGGGVRGLVGNAACVEPCHRGGGVITTTLGNLGCLLPSWRRDVEYLLIASEKKNEPWWPHVEAHGTPGPRALTKPRGPHVVVIN